MQDARNRILNPHTLPIMVCNTMGEIYFCNGTTKALCAVSCPVCENLLTEPLIVEDRIQDPPCHCEYVVVREHMLVVAMENKRFNRLKGNLFVYKFVTSKTTNYRVQIPISINDRIPVIKALQAAYG